VDEVNRRADESLDDYIARLEKLSAEVRDALVRAQRFREQGQMKTRLIRRPQMPDA
jgi:hypothetical protein